MSSEEDKTRVKSEGEEEKTRVKAEESEEDKTRVKPREEGEEDRTRVKAPTTPITTPAPLPPRPVNRRYLYLWFIAGLLTGLIVGLVLYLTAVQAIGVLHSSYVSLQSKYISLLNQYNACILHSGGTG